MRNLTGSSQLTRLYTRRWQGYEKHKRARATPDRLSENDFVMTPSDPTRSARSPQLIAKRVFDIIVSTAIMAVLLPLFLLVALAVRLDSRGPIFSISRKYCYNNQTVHVLSFRCSETFIGSSLVRSGLDRLPMLINVLRGEMSIVGLRCYIGPPSIPVSDQLSLALRNTAFRPGLVNFEDQHGHADLSYDRSRSICSISRIGRSCSTRKFSF